MKKIYEVYINNKKVKEFPTKEQADMYLLETGNIYSCKYGKFLKNNCKVIEKECSKITKKSKGFDLSKITASNLFEMEDDFMEIEDD